MAKVDSIMTQNPVFISQHANVHRARMLMAEKKIRHIPVKAAENGKLIGMLSQKSVLGNAIKIINQSGLDKLEHVEKSMAVESLMDTQPLVFDVNAAIIDVAKSLLENRSGCVAITESDKLVGVVTSNDFVKLAVAELA